MMAGQIWEWVNMEAWEEREAFRRTGRKGAGAQCLLLPASLL